MNSRFIPRTTIFASAVAAAVCVVVVAAAGWRVHQAVWAVALLAFCGYFIEGLIGGEGRQGPLRYILVLAVLGVVSGGASSTYEAASGGSAVLGAAAAAAGLGIGLAGVLVVIRRRIPYWAVVVAGTGLIDPVDRFFSTWGFDLPMTGFKVAQFAAVLAGVGIGVLVKARWVGKDGLTRAGAFKRLQAAACYLLPPVGIGLHLAKRREQGFLPSHARAATIWWIVYAGSLFVAKFVNDSARLSFLWVDGLGVNPGTVFVRYPDTAMLGALFVLLVSALAGETIGRIERGKRIWWGIMGIARDGRSAAPFVPWGTLAMILGAAVVVAVSSWISWPKLCEVMCLGTPFQNVATNRFLPRASLLHDVASLLLYEWLHDGWGHFGWNMIVLVLFGWFVERHFVEAGWGRMKYVAFAWALGAASGVGQLAWNSVYGAYTVGYGMSGVVYGVVGAFFLIGVRAPYWLKLLLGAIAARGAISNILLVTKGAGLLGWQVLSRLEPIEWSESAQRAYWLIGNQMHVVGIASGLALGWAIRRRTGLAKEGASAESVPARRERVLAAAGYFAVPVSVVSLVIADGSKFARRHAAASFAIWLAAAAKLLIPDAAWAPHGDFAKYTLPFVNLWVWGALAALSIGLAAKAVSGERIRLRPVAQDANPPRDR